MSSLFFTEDERKFIDSVIEQGLRQDKGIYRWQVVRLAIAQSLRNPELPDARFGVPSQRGSELELEQITGQGKGRAEDFDDAFRLLLSVRYKQDLFDPDNASEYLDLLQKHSRRGVAMIQSAWRPGRSFHDYLLDELYERPSSSEHASLGSTLEFGTLSSGLKQIGVAATLAGGAIEGPRLTRFRLTLGGVDDYDRLRKGLDDLAFAIGLGSAGIGLARELGERRVLIDIPRPSAMWKDVSWNDIRSALEMHDGELPVSPGVDVLGQPLIFDLVDAPHLFVAGATGSGKSVCLNALLLSMLASRRPPELIMIDPKGVDFMDYEKCSRLRGRKIIVDAGEAVSVLRDLVQEMEARQAILREFNARNLAEAQSNGSTLERVVVVIDELADFMMSKGGAEDPLIRLAQKARATGIHLVLATQRPEAATFPGLLRGNIPSRIALTVQKAADSRIILDESGAEKLLMRGDMLVKLAGRDAVRAHGARVEPSDIRTAVHAVNHR